MGGSLTLTNTSTSISSGETSVKQGSITNFILNPSVSYFVIDNLAVGADLSLVFTKSGENKTTTYGLAPSITYYFMEYSQLRPYLGLSVGVMGNSTGSGDRSVTTTSFAVGAKGGVAYFLNQNVALDMGLDYIYMTRNEPRNSIKEIGVSKPNTYRNNVGTLGVNVGLLFFF